MENSRVTFFLPLSAVVTGLHSVHYASSMSLDGSIKKRKVTEPEPAVADVMTSETAEASLSIDDALPEEMLLAICEHCAAEVCHPQSPLLYLGDQPLLFCCSSW